MKSFSAFALALSSSAVAQDWSGVHDGLLPLSSIPVTNGAGSTIGYETIYATAIATSTIAGDQVTTIYSDANGIVTAGAASIVSPPESSAAVPIIASVPTIASVHTIVSVPAIASSPAAATVATTVATTAASIGSSSSSVKVITSSVPTTLATAVTKTPDSISASGVAKTTGGPMPVSTSKAVFCHYLIGGLAADHATQDVSDAKAAGFDGFALNIADPTQSWATAAVTELFAAANSAGFKLFFSMDTSNSKITLSDWNSMMSTYLTNAAYYKGPNGKPFLSTFNNGDSFQVSDWTSFRSQHNVYFMPDFDNANGFYTDIDSWFGTWGSVVDGLYTWDTAWPAANAETPLNISTSRDETVMAVTKAHSKTYMAPLSSLQYKNLDASLGDGNNYYRIGELVLPQRMEQLLSLGQSSSPGTVSPDFVEVISWNDVGESHYIGNVWDDADPGAAYDYANSTSWSHADWQPLITSFITAFKAGGDSSTMVPPSGKTAIGSMWYRTILKDATCPNSPKPTGWQGAQDAVNWAVVVPQGESGYTVTVSSGGSVLQQGIKVSAGLNYHSTPNIKAGAQQVQLLDGTGKVVMTAKSAIDVLAETDGICNFNYQVAGMA